MSERLDRIEAILEGMAVERKADRQEMASLRTTVADLAQAVELDRQEREAERRSLAAQLQGDRQERERNGAPWPLNSKGNGKKEKRNSAPWPLNSKGNDKKEKRNSAPSKKRYFYGLRVHMLVNKHGKPIEFYELLVVIMMLKFDNLFALNYHQIR